MIHSTTQHFDVFPLSRYPLYISYVFDGKYDINIPIEKNTISITISAVIFFVDNSLGY